MIICVDYIQPKTGYKQKTPLMQGLSSIKVRRGRDSNSRYGYKPHTHLAGGRLSTTCYQVAYLEQESAMKIQWRNHHGITLQQQWHLVSINNP